MTPWVSSARTHEEGRQVPPRPEPRRAAREVRRSLPIASKHHATGTLALLLCACVRLSDVKTTACPARMTSAIWHCVFCTFVLQALLGGKLY